MRERRATRRESAYGAICRANSIARDLVIREMCTGRWPPVYNSRPRGYRAISKPYGGGGGFAARDPLSVGEKLGRDPESDDAPSISPTIRRRVCPKIDLLPAATYVPRRCARSIEPSLEAYIYSRNVN